MPISYRIVSLSALLLGFFVIGAHDVKALTRPITFPVLGYTSYRNDFGDPRVGHTHIGNDIFGKKMQPLLAAVTGTARQVSYPQPSYGYYISIQDAEGYEYIYIHINNDTSGTDDNKGGGKYAYAPSVERSWPVVAGQVIGYMGDSGNAESTSPHLHFEIHDPEDAPINPFFSLQAAKKLSAAVPTPVLPFEILPYGKFNIGANIATGDVVSAFDGKEIVVGAAAGAPPQIRIMAQDGAAAGGFYLPQKTFRGGVDVAVGDVNGDGVNEIITALGAGSQPLIQVHDNKGVVLSSFLAYAGRFPGGSRVSTADLDGNGVAEIITAAGKGGGPDVRVYTMSGNLLSSFYAYTSRFRGGVDVAGISANPTGSGRIVTTPLAGGGPDVRIYTAQGGFEASFYSGDSTFRGGLHVTTANDPTTGEPMIFTVPMSNARGIIRQQTRGGVVVNEHNVFERWWLGGFDVAVIDSTIFTSLTENFRRGSIMKTTWSASSSGRSWFDWNGF